MLDIVLKILLIIGIVLLVLLAVLLVVLLLVLFFPVTYRVFGKKNPDEIKAWVKLNWLFGLLRIRFYYPQPGNVTIKLLDFTLFDSAKAEPDTPTESDEASAKSANDKPQSPPDVMTQEAEHTSSNTNTSAEEASHDGETGSEEVQQGKVGIREWILGKYEKIKYTILKIYDKIKHIVDNISFYKRLLQDEETLGLVHHALHRLGRILKSIRPRKLKGDILFGTGSPDTTGYVFGLYGMLSAWLGNYINVTPDFTQSILEGELYIAGHITIFQLLRHGLSVAFDKRLRLLINRIKKHTL